MVDEITYSVSVLVVAVVNFIFGYYLRKANEKKTVANDSTREK